MTVSIEAQPHEIVGGFCQRWPWSKTSGILKMDYQS
jgi:hypothetical protein